MGNEEKTKYYSPSDEKKRTDEETLRPVYPWEIEQELEKMKLDPAIFDVDSWF